MEKQFNIRKDIFGMSKPGAAMITGFDQPNEYTPRLVPDYAFPEWGKDVVNWLAFMNEPLYICGPTGAGKTSCLRWLCAKINMPMYEVTGHSRLEFLELVGHNTVVNGSMSFVDGPLTMAMRSGGLFVINEFDLLDPSTAAGLNTILDGAPLIIPENGGEIIKPHPMFRFAATANSNGAGDTTGAYQGVLRQNIAMMDRFVVLEAQYLQPHVEVALIKSIANLPDEIVDRIVEYAGIVRDMFLGDFSKAGTSTPIDVTFSTRTVVRFARLLELYGKGKGDAVEKALTLSLLNRVDPVQKSALLELKQRVFG